MQLVPVLLQQLPFLTDPQQFRTVHSLRTLLSEVPEGEYLAPFLNGGVDPDLLGHLWNERHLLEFSIDRPLAPREAAALATIREILKIGEGGATHPFFRLERAVRESELVSEFGKVVSRLWSGDKAARKQEVDFWAPSGPRQRERHEVQGFFSDETAASRTFLRLSGLGYDVRRAMIPGEGSSDSIHWVVGRPGGNAWSHRIHRLFEGPPREATSFFPPHLRINGEAIAGPHNPEADRLIASLFGRPIPLREILTAFDPDTPGFRLSRLHLTRQPDKGIGVEGVVVDEEGRMAAEFTRVIPGPPPPGIPWVARGEGYNAGRLKEGHKRRGTARRLHQRLIGFLYRLGVDAFDLPATGEGLYVWPHLGFDFLRDSDRNTLKVRLRRCLMSGGVSFTPELWERLERLRHAWEFADFTHEGRPWGKDFMLGLEQAGPEPIPLRFRLGPDYPGYALLFGK